MLLGTNARKVIPVGMLGRQGTQEPPWLSVAYASRLDIQPPPSPSQIPSVGRRRGAILISGMAHIAWETALTVLQGRQVRCLWRCPRLRRSVLRLRHPSCAEGYPSESSLHWWILHQGGSPRRQREFPRLLGHARQCTNFGFSPSKCVLRWSVCLGTYGAKA